MPLVPAPVPPGQAIYLDGKPVPNATVSSTGDNGWVLMPKYNERGEILLDPETGNIAHDCRYGRVELREVS